MPGGGSKDDYFWSRIAVLTQKRERNSRIQSVVFKYTLHAEEKLALSSSRKLGTTKASLQHVVEQPIALDTSEKPVVITIGDLTETLSLCVGYRIIEDAIRIITFYPAGTCSEVLKLKEDMSVKDYQDDDLLVIKLSRKSFKIAEKIGSFIVHYDANREPVSIEILNASKLLREASKALPKEVRELIFAPTSHQ